MSTYTGLLIASSGDCWRCHYRLEVEAENPDMARRKLRAAWQEQSSRPGMHIREVRLWQDGVPVPPDIDSE